MRNWKGGYVNHWETLFDQALTCWQSILTTGAPVPDWTFGGGTRKSMISLVYNAYDLRKDPESSV